MRASRTARGPGHRPILKGYRPVTTAIRKAEVGAGCRAPGGRVEGDAVPDVMVEGRERCAPRA